MRELLDGGGGGYRVVATAKAVAKVGNLEKLPYRRYTGTPQIVYKVTAYKVNPDVR